MTPQSKIDKLILVLNMVTYRIDALLANAIDVIMISAYTTIVSKALNLLNASLDEVIYLLGVTIILTHIAYMIVYLLNDLIDYSTAYLSKVDYSFYRLRPVFYFRRALWIIVYSALLYVTGITAILITIPTISGPTLIFIPVFIVTAIMHSYARGIHRIITFLMLRFSKYIYTLVAFSMLSFGEINTYVLLLTTFSIIIPYLAYSSTGYSRLKGLKTRSLNGIAYLIPVLSILMAIPLGMTLLGYSIFDLLRALLCGYFYIILPLTIVRQMLRRPLGAVNPTFYHHLLRLSLGFVAAFSISILVILLS
ncbi:MAG: hypothetical protein B7O98_08995 [Zestosphaera tikiterensis]|uniref:Prenyltransferase n=1 Tax=Zestosphaera tikiterensis TaxID=1973259 RepID=A0A2R7Y254_9CREN|nr:MAG: hypothetical protein B7O98_08995 [Zestosphaera tikiterensis]